MTWFKVDDSFWGHPKRLACTSAAIGLWVTAGSWSAQQLTDGVVPTHVLPVLGGRAADAKSLVSAGLWEVVDTGWLFHDWADWQPTKAQVHERRDAEAKRKQEWRDKKAARRPSDADVPPDATRDTDVAGRGTDADVRSTRPVPSRPDPTRPETSSPRSASPQKRASKAPEKFEITSHLREWAAKEGIRVDLERETQKFLDRHAATGASFVDWTRAWYTWMRNAQEYALRDGRLAVAGAARRSGNGPDGAWEEG